jgi:hypothetical protein
MVYQTLKPLLIMVDYYEFVFSNEYRHETSRRSSK